VQVAPTEPRIAQKNQGGVPATPLSARPRVHFSQFNELAMIPYDDSHPKWYTRKEEQHFKLAVSADVRIKKMLM